MAVVKLELELDSVAHPELYAMVAAVANESLRAERVRQLAATGMIWERLRLSAGAAPAGSGKAESASASPHLALVTSAKPSSLEALDLPVLRDEVSFGGKSVPLPPDDDEASAQALEPITAPLPAVHMPGTRSRLMRMKNRGLFTNE